MLEADKMTFLHLKKQKYTISTVHKFSDKINIFNFKKLITDW